MDDLNSEYPRESEWRCDASFEDEDVTSSFTIDTYASTNSSRLSLHASEPSDYPVRARNVLAWMEPTPTTSLAFSTLFPSSRRLTIRHDDATEDGNLNLRVDTLAGSPGGCQRAMTLFHLRMRDLRSRRFSLRRYHRDSGREICHSSAKVPVPAASKLPVLQASLSSAIATLRTRKHSTASETDGLRRRDSGYGSMESDRSVEGMPNISPQQVSFDFGSVDLINLEFSNYAHVDITRKGQKRSKRYDFEYWGLRYSWKPTTRPGTLGIEVHYSLYRHADRRVVARMVPLNLTQVEAHEEMARGGWVPPCCMWINDRELLEEVTGVSDVVVATGLISLVDDTIRRRFQSQEKNNVAPSLPAMIPLINRLRGTQKR